MELFNILFASLALSIDSKTEPFIFEHSDDIRLKHTGMNTK